MVDAIIPDIAASGEAVFVKGAFLDQAGVRIEFPLGMAATFNASVTGAQTSVPDGAGTGLLRASVSGKTSNAVRFRFAEENTEGWSNIALGSYHSCGLKGDRLLCWGDNTSAQVGNGETDDSPVSYPLEVSGPVAWKAVAPGKYLEHGNTCALDADGALWCWGNGGTAQYGKAGAKAVEKPARTHGGPWQTLVLGAAHACALDGKGELYCWGSSSDGQTGLGAEDVTFKSPTRVAAPGTPASWSLLSAGSNHTCGIAEATKELYCWGDNLARQIGVGTEENYLTPQTVSAGQQWTLVNAGHYAVYGNTCAIRIDGSLWCWGDNGLGQLGLGHSEDATRPTLVDAGPWADVSIGGSHTCGVKKDGTLWCWGADPTGQLGNGDGIKNSNKPVKIGADSDWLGAEAGGAHACALKTNGSLYCWGENRLGQLGVIPNDDRVRGSPEPVLHEVVP